MARMIPEQISSDTQSYAEIKAFNHFSSMFNAEWTIFHSFGMTGENRETNIIDSEADFILFNPKYGIILMEVKGGIIEFDGNWKCRQNSKEIKDPATQARLNKYNLEKALKKRLFAGEPKIRFAHSVYFPDSYVDTTKLHPSYDRITFTANDTPFIDKAVINLFENIKNPREDEIPEGLANFIVNALSPKITIGNSFLDRIMKNERLFDSLSEIQSQLLKFIGNYRHAMIEGCAGSGKTVLAIMKARQLAMDGKKILLLCYNIPLGRKLRESIADFKDQIYAGNYHDFCLECLNNSKYREELPELKTRKDFWEKVLPEMMQKYIADYPLQYDAIIVDEAQDFRDSYWLSLCDLFSHDKIFYLFYDPGQNVFSTDMSFPAELIPFSLNRVCRNTSAIFDYMKKYSVIACELYKEMPTGDSVEEYRSADVNERVKILGRILKIIIHEQQINPDDIVILGGHSFNNTILENTSKFTDIVVIDCSEDLPENLTSTNEKHVKYFTYMRFKGCEAEVIILLDVDESDPRWSKSALYTAVSRAKNLLFVIRK